MGSLQFDRSTVHPAASGATPDVRPRASQAFAGVVFVGAAAAAAALGGLANRARPVGSESTDGAVVTAGYVDRAVAHYERAERELAATDVSGLSATWRAARERTLADLRAYRERRDFGRHADAADADERVHLFVDSDGRRCAVAELMHRSGHDGLVAAVARADNRAFVADLAGDPRFLGWLDGAGITLEEAARIQGPSVPQTPTAEIDGPASPPTDTTTGTPTGTPTTGTPREPGNTSPGGRPTSGGGGFPGPATGGAPRGRGATGGSSPFAGVGADSWWVWWELEKLTWMRPARAALEPLPTAGYDAADDLASRRELALLRLLPLLEHRDAAVRAAAAGAVGRLGGGGGVDRLTALLDDPDLSVRQRAILALGATGDRRAAEGLLHVARTGAFTSGPHASQIGYGSRPLAVVALGVARRHGLVLDPSAAVAELVRHGASSDGGDLAVAGALYDRLAPSERVARALAEVADDPRARAAARSRALESIAPSGDAGRVRAMQKALGDRETDVRRAAAVALGDMTHALVAPHLMTAHEMERDGLARGFLLVSIARRGGDRATTYLPATLEDREEGLRPWSALALGVLVREHGTTAVLPGLQALRLRSQDTGAVWLARAIAGDATAAEPCSDALSDPSPRVRAHAAAALGILGGDGSLDALRRRAADESEDLPSVVIAHAIALRGRPEDSAALLAQARKFRPDWLRTELSMALGVHRTRRTLEGLLDTLASPRSSAVQLAVAAEAVGLALDAVPEPSLPTLGRHTNFATMPQWLLDALRSTL